MILSFGQRKKLATCTPCMLLRSLTIMTQFGFKVQHHVGRGDLAITQDKEPVLPDLSSLERFHEKDHGKETPAALVKNGCNSPYSLAVKEMALGALGPEMVCVCAKALIFPGTVFWSHLEDTTLLDVSTWSSVT